ncbi:MAG TPA: hypothetical protein VHC90_14185 [Bryobacteraceae bacterium]|nr:hypothetical protein [Bryobacteraceae bacterium]
MAEVETAVLGTVRNRAHAETCIDSLWKAGFRSDDISVLAADHRLAKELTAEKHTHDPAHPAADAEVGATLGIEIGGGIGLLAGFGALGIPGLGAFIAAGPILATLMGAGIGGVSGGIIGALAGMGVSEYEATRYHERVKAGGILLVVHSDNPEWRDRAQNLLKRCGAEDISLADRKVLGLHVSSAPQ